MSHVPVLLDSTFLLFILNPLLNSLFSTTLLMMEFIFNITPVGKRYIGTKAGCPCCSKVLLSVGSQCSRTTTRWHQMN